MDSPLHYTILVPESEDAKFQALLTEARAAGLNFEVTGIGIDVEDGEGHDEGALTSEQEMRFERRLLEEGR